MKQFKNRLKFFVIITFLISSANNGYSVLSGKLSIEQGNAIYTIPIEVGKGRAGAQPDISLNYNSAARNGMMGVGWSLQGLSAISRCAKTIAQDGIKKEINYDDNDNFCYQNRKLISVGNNEYRTEIDKHLKIMKINDYWKVWTKSGQIYTYGKDHSSRIIPSNRRLLGNVNFDNVHSWLLNKISNHSNGIDFNYHNVENEIYIQEINFIGGKIEFIYEDRKDTRVFYSKGGVLTKQNKRLSEIKSYIDNLLWKKYILTYSEIFNISKLESVKECDINNICEQEIKFYEPSMRFRYSQEEIGIPSYHEYHFHWSIEHYGWAEKWYEDLGDDWKNRPNHENGEYTMLIDMNGDGLPDKVFDRNSHTDEQGFYVMLNTGSSFGYGSQWYRDFGDDWKNRPNHENGEHTMLIDMNGDGLPDKVFDRNPHTDEKGFYVMLNISNMKNKPRIPDYLHNFHTGSQWYRDFGDDWKNRPNHENGEHTMLIDMNGDGLPDKVFGQNPHTDEQGFYVMLNTGSSFDYGSQWHSDLGDDWKNRPVHEKGKLTMLIDMNGDGLPDKVFGQNPHTDEQGFYVMLNTGSSFDYGSQWYRDLGEDWKNQPKEEEDSGRTMLVDMNGDGLPDKVFGQNPHTDEQGFYVMLNTGSSFEKGSQWHKDLGREVANRPQYFERSGGDFQTGMIQILKDMNNDGLPDHVFTFHPLYNALGGLFVMFNTGNSLSDIVKLHNDLNPEFKLTGQECLNRLYCQERNSTWSTLLDMNGDGLPDRVFDRNYADRQGISVKLNTLQNLFLIRNIEVTNTNFETHNYTPGDYKLDWLKPTLFISNIIIDYSSLDNNSIYTNQERSIYPILSGSFGQTVVSQVKESNGVGGHNTLKYQYGELKANIHGRGSLGFKWIETHNVDSNKITHTEYFQEFPFTGLVKKVEEKLDSQLINSTQYNYEFKDGKKPKIKQIYLTNSIQKSYELNSFLNQPITTVTSNYSYANNHFGDLIQLIKTTKSGGEIYSQITQSQYASANTQNWILSRLASSSVTHTHSNGSKITRQSSFSYYPNGLLKSETIAPDHHRLALTTEYKYDHYGNVIKTITSAPEVKERINTHIYDNQGIRLIKTTNALGHSEEYSYDNYGNLITLTNSNNLQVSWEYDNQNRKIKETRPDGTITTWQYKWEYSHQTGTYSWTNDNLTHKITKTSSGNSPIVIITDILGRKIRKITTSFKGKKIFQDTAYDRFSRVKQQSLNYFKGDTPYWINYSYDALGRKTAIENTSNNTTNSISYDGLSTQFTNEKGLITTKINNVYGKVAQITDTMGGVVSYEYNAIGDLTKTTDAEAHQTILEYDNLGNKIATQDPNLGRWNYKYDAFGQLIQQTDAKGQEVRIYYDQLNRKIRKTEKESEVTWIYDTGDNAFGKLVKVSSPNTIKTYSYDSLGRIKISNTKLEEDNLSTNINYDQYSRISSKDYPKGYKLIYSYNENGFLKSVKTPEGLNVDGYDRRHLEAVRDRALEVAQRLINQSTDWYEAAQRYEQEGQYYQDTAQEIRNIANNYSRWGSYLLHYASLMENYAEQNLTLAERYLYWAENPHLATQLLQQAELYNNNLSDKANIIYWQANDYDAMGRSTSFILGNGLITNNVYNSAGQLEQIDTGFGYDVPIRQLEYQYDEVNNITNRIDKVEKIHESFVYDNLNRLVTSSLNEKLPNKKTELPQPQNLQGTWSKSGGRQFSHSGNPKHSFSLKDTATVSIDLTSRIDTYLYLLDSQGQIVAKDDDGGLGVNSHITKELNAGEYQLVAATYSYGRRGSYNLEINFEQNETHTDKWTVSGGRSATHKGNPVIPFYVNKTGKVSIDMTSRVDTYLYLLDKQGKIISRNDDGGLGLNSRIIRTLTAGDYQLVAASYRRGQTGKFSLMLRGDAVFNKDDNQAFVGGSWQYSASGNILDNSGEAYTYDENKPYAVSTAKGHSYSYDANGNVIQKDDTKIEWTTTNKPSRFIESNGAMTQFFYDEKGSRYKKIDNEGTITYYLGKSYERIIDNTGKITHKYFVYAEGNLVAIHIKEENINKVRYLHKDNLGSVDAITDGVGKIVNRMKFSTFGSRADTNWMPATEAIKTVFTNRGFTGHEHIDELGLIHMNGRVYDPQIGRFLSADRFIQSPLNSQNYNRYSYVLNNPLKYTDPSGYFFNVINEIIEEVHAVGEQISNNIGVPIMHNVSQIANPIGEAAGKFGKETTGLIDGTIKDIERDPFTFVASVGAAYGCTAMGADPTTAAGCASATKEFIYGYRKGGLEEGLRRAPVGYARGYVAASITLGICNYAMESTACTDAAKVGLPKALFEGSSVNFTSIGYEVTVIGIDSFLEKGLESLGIEQGQDQDQHKKKLDEDDKNQIIYSMTSQHENNKNNPLRVY